jgi:protein phosphatase
MNYKYTSLSKIGFKRSTNEDSIGVFELPDGLLIIVCDGLGGNNAGEVASSLSVETIHSNFISLDGWNYLEKIKYSILKANKLLTEKSSINSKLSGMATTVEVLFLKDSTAYWGHVGDSRIYFSKNGRLQQITKDHSLVQKLVDEGYLSLKEAENHPNRNVIMRALGDNGNVEIDLSKQSFFPYDDVKFFVCTDGVTCVMSNDEIQNLLNEKSLSLSSELFNKVIEERGAPDNFSYVIIEVSA